MSNSYTIKVARPLCLSEARSKSWINSAVVKRFSSALAIWWARWCCHFVSYSALTYLKPRFFPLFLLLNFIIVQLEGSARIGGHSAVALNNIAATRRMHNVGVNAHREPWFPSQHLLIGQLMDLFFWDWRLLSTEQANSHGFVLFSFVSNIRCN